MAETVSDVLGRVAQVNQQLGLLLVELLNHPDDEEQAERLREVGRLLRSLSADVLARAAEVDGRTLDVERVVIDARP